MAYNSTTGIVSAPVGVGDVQLALSTSKNDIGKLCIHDSIIKWAKYKPVSYPSVTANGDTGYEWKGDEPTIKPYGIALKVAYNEYDDCLQENLSYKRPSGGESSPYRLGDFRGYNKNAVCPYYVEVPDGEYPENQGMVRVLVENYGSDNLPTGNLTLLDIYPKGYFCAIVTDGKTTYYKALSITSQQTMTISDCPLFVSGASLTVVVCMASKAISSWTTVADGITFYGLQCDECDCVGSVSVTGELKQNYSFSATFSDGKKKLSFGEAERTTAGRLVCTAKYIGAAILKSGDEYDFDYMTITATNQATGAVTTTTVQRSEMSGSDDWMTIGYNEYYIDQETNPQIDIDAKYVTASDGAYYNWVVDLHYTKE